MGRIAALFTGQGAQTPGMGKDLFDACPAAREIFEQANNALGFDLARICFEGSAADLEKTDIQQPAILTVAVAAHRAMEDCVGKPINFEASAGLSLGEYGALVLSGVFDFPTAVRVVHQRGTLMQQASESTPGGMVTVLGLDEAAVAEVCEELQSKGVLQPANFNCPGQIVISGSLAACEAAPAVVEAKGGRAKALPVAGAFHSPLMQPAADGLRSVLSSVEFAHRIVPVVANVTGEYHPADGALTESLVSQVTSPIRWQASMERLIADGFDRFVEFGPGRVLAGLMRKIDRSVKIQSVGTVAALEDLSLLKDHDGV